MFGYVIVDKPNMLIKDYADYRAYYCGLCKSLGKEFSQMARFTINYDITFLTLLLHNYEKLQPEYENARCIAHPIGAKKPMVKSNYIQNKVANINIVMAYYKLLDDVIDDNKVKHKLLLKFIKPKYNKAKKMLPHLDNAMKFYYDKLREKEKNKLIRLDELADCFANIMVEIGKTTENFDDNLKELCYNLGRWIYIIDALDDLKEDFLKRKYNPLIENDNIKFDTDFKEKQKQEIGNLLRIAIAKIRLAYDKMDITISEGPLSNIVYLGLEARTQSVLEKI